MEMDSGSYIYQDLMSKAYWTKEGMDRRPVYFDKEIAKDDYKSFLEEKVKCPTRAKLAMQKVYNRDGVNYGEFCRMHKSILEKNPEIDALVKQVDEVEKKQAKTLTLRNKLIESNRICLDGVMPKLSGFQKILFKFKMLF